MKAFRKRYSQLVDEVYAYLDFTVSAMGEVVFFDFDTMSIEDNCDAYNDLPGVQSVDRHNEILSYNIIALKWVNSQIICVGYCDQEEVHAQFNGFDLDLDNLIMAAQLIEAGRFVLKK